ncbi:GPR endopeptidase [Paenibacillus sp. 32O-W]|jgi:spore protease|uniref:Germination protease n=1 Tax=Paenibacillus cisolokensis TaxID=1658519 RepID=A0ABQ4N268_9BACL|nr:MULTISPECIES: GPR endopeptidase [Paenibacillus]ALS27264.1 GPR endopeptidase [Paenibacillus sp. 32O-W]GIQ62264.1 germination protease [Paenibacillus cisolokensis]
MSKLDLQQYSVRTDLALEAKEIAEAGGGKPIPGVQAQTDEEDGIIVTKLQVENEQGARAIGKMIGNYVTIEVPGLRSGDTELQNRVATKVSQEFEAFLERIGVGRTAKILIVGLGNWNVTPDALGPLVVENVMVTRHYFELMPDQVAPGYRSVSAVAPGVMGTTGIESSEIVQGIVERTKPDVVIAIDALASKALERVNTTIQIADTGIHPGSGIGNKRRGLTKEILGIPIIAIGVPTVVYASTIVNNTMEMMQRHIQSHNGDTDKIFGMMNQMEDNERLRFVKEVLAPLGHDLLVTPKEIDQFIEDIANIIASGLNASLHEAIDSNNVAAYTH